MIPYNWEQPPAYAETGAERLIQNLAHAPEDAILADETTHVALMSYGGRTFVMRKPGRHINDVDPHMLLRRRAAALIVGLGNAALEHLVAYSPEQETIATDYVSSPTLDTLPTAIVEQIDEDHYKGLLDTIEWMSSHNLQPDTGHPDNYLFTLDGFFLIDYSGVDPNGPTAGEHPATTYLKFLAMMIDYVGVSDDPAYKQAWLQSCHKGLDVVRQRYPGAGEGLTPGLDWLRDLIRIVDEDLGSEPT